MSALAYKTTKNIIEVRISENDNPRDGVRMDIGVMARNNMRETAELTIAQVLDSIYNLLLNHFTSNFEVNDDLIEKLVSRMMPAVSTIVRRTIRERN